MSFRSVLVCYTAGFTTIITTLRRITIGKEIYFLRTGILQTQCVWQQRTIEIPPLVRRTTTARNIDTIA